MGEEGVKAETNASPSVHPSPPVPDVLPDDYFFLKFFSKQAGANILS